MGSTVWMADGPNLQECINLLISRIHNHNQLSLQMSNKKKYRPKNSAANDSLSTISFNDTLNLTEPSILTVPPEPSSSRVEVHDLSTFIDDNASKTYKFPYNFNEYLRFFLIKALPLKERDMEINPAEETLRGPQAKCEKLLKNVKNQLEKFTVKVVKYNEDADIEEIQYQLEKEYNLKIFKRKFLQLTTHDIMKTYGFEEAANKFIARIEQEQIIVVRVEKKHEEQCFQQIRLLITKKDADTTSLSASRHIERNRQNDGRHTERDREGAREREREREKEKEREREAKERERLRAEREEKEKEAKKKGKGKQEKPKSQGSSSDEIVEEEDEPTYYQNQSQLQIKSPKSDFRQFSQHPSFKKFEEPTEDDSISVAGERRRKKQDRQAQNLRYKEREQIVYKAESAERYREERQVDNRRQGGRRYKEEEEELQKIKQYEYEEFDEAGFESWLKNHRILNNGYVKVVSKEDPYNSTILTHSVQLYCQKGNDKQEDDLVEALEFYLKFRRVVIVKVQNEKYRDQLVQKYEQDSEALTVRFIKGYKSPKWTEQQMWKHIVKKTYTENKRQSNSEYFELFFVEGLKNLVIETEKEIRENLQSEPKGDEMEELIIKFAPEIADHLRNNKRLQEVIREYAERLVSGNFKHCCTIFSAEFPLSNLKLTLQVKSDQFSLYEKTVSAQIQERIQTEIKISEFKAPGQIDKHTYGELDKIATITHREEKAFKYICSIYNMGELLQKMNNVINAQNKLADRDLIIADKVVAKKLGDYLAEIVAANSEYADIKHQYVSDQSKYKFYGQEYRLLALLKELQQFIVEFGEKRISYFQIVKRREGDLLEKGTVMRDISSKYGIVIHTAQTELPCRLTLAAPSDQFRKKNILIVKSKSLDYAPCGSVILFRALPEVDLFKANYFIKTFRNYINKHKAEIFDEHTRGYTMMIKPNLPVDAALREALGVQSNTANHIIMVMPEKGKEEFVKAIIKELLENKKFEGREITILIIEYGLNTDLQQQLNISPYVKGKKLQLKDEKLRKYYVEDQTKKFYYSDSGNRKILLASEKGFNKVILNNEDLNIMHVSHAFHSQTLTITHLQSQKQFPIRVNNTKVEFVLKNETYQVPQAESQNIFAAIKANTPKIDLSLGVYEIDLYAMTQINLFSDYQRKLCFEETIIKAELNQEQVQAYYNVKVSQVEYSYYFDDTVLDNFTVAVESISSFLQSHVKQKNISYKQLKHIETADLEGIKAAIEEDEETECNYNVGTKLITLKTLDETTLNRCEQMINMLIKNLNERDPQKIKFPDSWQPQKEDIQTFEVMRNTPEFTRVQNMFTVAPIKSLHRIQNKIIYKKYFEEGAFLESLNEGKKVRRMELFHGTRTTIPEEIYKDKEESFNINYSSDNNLLGKGIYFAEKSEYSNSYKYTEMVGGGKIFGLGTSNIYSMFLCEVLVGDSQKCMQHNGAIKDTGFKDPIKKIKYESMTDFLSNSNIFVVYKSRRAYPLYLIKY